MPDEKQGNDQSVKPVAGSQPPVASESKAAGNEQPAAAEAASKPAEPTEVKAADAEKPAVTTPTAPSTPAKPAAPAAAKPATPAAPPGAKPATPAAPGAAKPAAPAAASAAKPVAPPKPEGPKPMPWDSDIAKRLKASYGSGLKEASTYVGQNYLVVDKTIAHEVLSLLRDDGFDYCVDVTAVHYPKKDEQFELVYILYSFPKNERLRVKTSIKEGEKIATATDIWETANWLEREVFDMFGIEFEGHPDPRRILLPEDWKGHPLRKDHDILKQDEEWVHIHLGIESAQ
jgi:NADH-quinone oxidoreductase subunit C